MTNVVIDLTKDAIPRVLNLENLIHRQDCYNLYKLICDRTYDSKNEIESKVYNFISTDRKENTFFINGSRGSGKTTFMMSLIDELLQQKKNGEDKPKPKPKPNLDLLGWFDPTMVETREHIFYSLIQYLKELVEEKQICVNQRNREKTDYEGWRKQLKRLAKGLSLLDSSKNTYSMDAILNMEEGLSRAKGGDELEKDFHVLLDQSAKALNVDAFIVAFDDIDMKSEKGWEILELIRKYLSSSKLIVLVSGDLELYNWIVRKKYREQLGNELQEDLLKQLVYQYLLKVFPARYRINLSPFQGLINKNKNFKLRLAKGEDPKDFDEAMNDIVKECWKVNDKQDIEAYKTILLSYPLRDIIQMLMSSLPILLKKGENQ